MKTRIEYDAKRGIGRIHFASHVTKVHGSREFCERHLKWLEHDADLAYQSAIKVGRGESEAQKLRDWMVSTGLMTR